MLGDDERIVAQHRRHRRRPHRRAWRLLVRARSPSERSDPRNVSQPGERVAHDRHLLELDGAQFAVEVRGVPGPQVTSSRTRPSVRLPGWPLVLIARGRWPPGSPYSRRTPPGSRACGPRGRPPCRTPRLESSTALTPTTSASTPEGNVCSLAAGVAGPDGSRATCWAISSSVAIRRGANATRPRHTITNVPTGRGDSRPTASEDSTDSVTNAAVCSSPTVHRPPSQRRPTSARATARGVGHHVQMSDHVRRSDGASSAAAAPADAASVYSSSKTLMPTSSRTRDTRSRSPAECHNAALPDRTHPTAPPSVCVTEHVGCRVFGHTDRVPPGCDRLVGCRDVWSRRSDGGGGGGGRRPRPCRTGGRDGQRLPLRCGRRPETPRWSSMGSTPCVQCRRCRLRRLRRAPCTTCCRRTVTTWSSCSRCGRHRVRSVRRDHVAVRVAAGVGCQ